MLILDFFLYVKKSLFFLLSQWSWVAFEYPCVSCGYVLLKINVRGMANKTIVHISEYTPVQK